MSKRKSPDRGPGGARRSPVVLNAMTSVQILFSGEWTDRLVVPEGASR